jgi:hypothetical protein
MIAYKNKFLSICLLVIAITIGYLTFKRGPSKPTPPSTQQMQSPTEMESSKVSPPSSPSSPIRTEISKQSPAPIVQTEVRKAESHQEALEQMHEASITYDKAQLKVIQPYLTHPDAELRSAAINAMVVLGDASAGPLLREASKNASSPREAVAMEEAADYVELPSADFKALLEELKNQPKKPKTVPETDKKSIIR